MEFKPFDKIPRLKRSCFVTEKIDGTNASVFIELKSAMSKEDLDTLPWVGAGDLIIAAGSRTKWISPGDDNYGFAAWVFKNSEDLAKLGPGQHYGEWWGQGIQRRYGLTEKRFSLFNTGRWLNEPSKPECCHVVPVIYHGDFSTIAIDEALESLRKNGSVAAPGFMNPEGIVIYHTASRELFKVTLDNDAIPKSLADKAKAERTK